MTGGTVNGGTDAKDRPPTGMEASSNRAAPAPDGGTSETKAVGKEVGPRRYYVSRGELWTLRQRVDHGLNLIIVGMAVSLLANGLIFLTPMSLWSIYLAQIMNFLGTIVVFFGVLSIYFRLKD